MKFNPDGFTPASSELSMKPLFYVYYRLTKEAAVPGWSDTEEAIGRWFRSCVEYDGSTIRDYHYPSALQGDGSWMTCGRVVKDWSKVELYPSVQ